jgi:TonB family protein
MRGDEFILLRPEKSNWKAMGMSVIFQIALVTLVLLIPIVVPPGGIPRSRFNVMPLTTLRAELPLPLRAHQVPPERRHLPKEKGVVPAPVHPNAFVASLAVPTVRRHRPEPVESPKIPRVLEAVRIEGDATLPPNIKPPIQTEVFNSDRTALVRATNPVEKVQTGGFGDANGLGKSGSLKNPGNVNAVGFFDFSTGPGNGSGTAGVRGIRGTVLHTSFGDGEGLSQGEGGRYPRSAGREGSFTSLDLQAERPQSQKQQEDVAFKPVEILERPSPEYTAEARDNKIEGEVLLEVVFKATREIRVLRVLHGLGYGLDESAIRAAKRLRYKPAVSHGEPVDFPAKVHITFQLAY